MSGDFYLYGKCQKNMAQKFVLARKRNVPKPKLLLGGRPMVNLLKEVHKASVSSVVAIAFVLFAASSVAALTSVAKVEVANSEYIAPIESKIAFNISPKVLGEIAYSPVVLFDKSNLTLKVTPHDFDATSGMWSYVVSWDRVAGKSGSIILDKDLIVTSASGTGEFETKYVLSPETKHRITFYSQENGKGVKIVNKRGFTTLAGDTNTDSVDQEDPNPELNIDNLFATSSSSSTPFEIKDIRVGKLVIVDKAIFLVTPKGLLVIPDMNIFRSWCFDTKEIKPANPAERALPHIGKVGGLGKDMPLPDWTKKIQVGTCEDRMKEHGQKASSTEDSLKLGEIHDRRINSSSTIPALRPERELRGLASSTEFRITSGGPDTRR